MATNTDLETIRRTQIITAALAKLSEAGSFEVTLDDIARAAGLSKGGLAHYFSSKEELVRAAFREFFDRIFLRSKETMDRCPDPVSKLLSFSWLYNWDDPDVNLGYPLLFDCMALAARDPEYRALFHDWVRSWIVLLEEAVHEGIKRGVIPKCDPSGKAKAISAIYHGIALRWYLDRESHSTEWAVRSFTEAITRLVQNIPKKR